ncbi:MAG: hypothetical protein MI757_13095, partial [Pirellulales bacterium]|nr:hypothetical protein [Pirellulales bacterium]
LALPAMLLTGWAMALPDVSRPGIVGYFVIVLIAEGWALRGYARAFRRKPARAAQATASTAAAASESSPSVPREPIRIDPPQTPSPHFPTEDIAQQLVRRVDAEGNDVAEGWVRAAFEPSQRTASVHVMFCPTLEGELSIECEQVDGAEARVKAAQLLPYGVRFDVKLADAAERAESVLIEFAAKGDAALARAMPVSERSSSLS